MRIQTVRANALKKHSQSMRWQRSGSPVTCDGRGLKLPKSAPWKHELLSQLLRFPAAKFDDGVDVMSLFGRGLEFVRGNKAKPKAVGVQNSWVDQQSWMG